MNGRRPLVAIACALAATLVPTTAHATADTVAERKAIDTSSRAAVEAAYRAEFDRTEPDIGWTGSISRCDPGTTSAAFRASVLQRINYYRAMAGSPPVQELAAGTGLAQAAALVMAANGDLSHFPPSDWRCWSQTAADGASTSNLHLGSVGVDAIDGYMIDYGDNNGAVGHRRWLLLPGLGGISTGDVPNTDDRSGSNALRVISDGNEDLVPSSRPGGIMTWPSPGYFPSQLLPTRWHFTLPEARFDDATLSVTRNGQPVAHSTPIAEYGPDGVALVWEITPPDLDADATFHVEVSNVDVGGYSSETVTRRSFAYDVTAAVYNRAPTTVRVGGVGMVTNLPGPGGYLGWLDAVDPDGDELTYRLVAGSGDDDNDLVEINGFEIYLRGNVPWHLRQALSIRVEARDDKGAAVTKALVVQPSGSLAAPQRFIARAHWDFLGRMPTYVEHDRWIDAQQYTGRDVLLRELVTSTEWAGAIVERMYRDTLGRSADESGRAFWLDRIRRGTPIAQIAAEFYGSDEFFARNGNDPGRWVDSLYRALLGRSADAGGRAGWIDAVTRQPRSEIAIGFYQSVENRQRRVSALYGQLLHRAPEREGLDHWTAQLANGDDLALAVHLAASEEYYRT